MVFVQSVQRSLPIYLFKPFANSDSPKSIVKSIFTFHLDGQSDRANSD